MPKPKILTDSNIKSLRYSGSTNPVMDGSLRGFGVKVGKQRKTFILRYQVSCGNKQSDKFHKIGTYPHLPIKAARDKAYELKESIRNGIYPHELVAQEKERLKQAALDSLTFSVVSENWYQ